MTHLEGPTDGIVGFFAFHLVSACTRRSRISKVGLERIANPGYVWLLTETQNRDFISVVQLVSLQKVNDPYQQDHCIQLSHVNPTLSFVSFVNSAIASGKEQLLYTSTT